MIKVSKIIILVLLAMIFGGLLYINVKPLRIYKGDFSGLSSPISLASDGKGEVVALESIEGSDRKMLVMKKDQLYFDVSLNDVFTSVTFRVKFYNPNHSQFNLGVPTHESVNDAVRYILEEKDLDSLKSDSDWINLQEQSTLVLQKRAATQKKFNSVSEFIKNLPVSKDNKGLVAKIGDYVFPFDSYLQKTEIVSSEAFPEDIHKFDYLIARYEPVAKEDDWSVNEYEVVIPEFFRRKNVKLPFYLEAKNLELENGSILIDSVEVTLKKPRFYNNTVLKIK